MMSFHMHQTIANAVVDGNSTCWFSKCYGRSSLVGMEDNDIALRETRRARLRYWIDTDKAIADSGNVEAWCAYYSQFSAKPLTPSYIRQLVPKTGEPTRFIGEKKARELERIGGMAPLWLDGVGLMEDREKFIISGKNPDALQLLANVVTREEAAESLALTQADAVESMRVAPIAKQAGGDDFTIPQYAVGVSMGYGLVLPEQPGVIERWTVNNEWLEKNVRSYTAKKNLCIVTGFGPSMQPMFNPGDPLLVDTGITRVLADGVYFFRIGEEGYIKQLQKLPKPGGGVIYRAKSVNPSYDPFDIDDCHDFEVLGKVVRVWCGTDF